MLSLNVPSSHTRLVAKRFHLLNMKSFSSSITEEAPQDIIKRFIAAQWRGQKVELSETQKSQCAAARFLRLDHAALSADMVRLVATWCPEVTHLNLSRAIMDDSVLQATSAFRKLNTLEVNTCTPGDRALVGTLFPNLQQLFFWKCYSIDERNFRGWARSFPKLRRLYIDAPHDKIRTIHKLLACVKKIQTQDQVSSNQFSASSI